MRKVESVAILDLWTDSNRGDAALQLALVGLIRRQYPDAVVHGIFRFGTNEIDAARPEIELTSAVLDVVHGGLRRTDYAEAGIGRWTRAGHLLLSLWSFVEASLCVALFRTVGRRSRRLLGRARYETLRILASADVVVWKGKNFREYDGLTGVTRAMTLTGAALLASFTRRSILCINASFWRIRQPAQRAIYRVAFRRCPAVTVRDAASLTNARELLGERVHVRLCPDLAFATVSEPGRLPAATVPLQERRDVALTITAWGTRADRARYLDALVATCGALGDLGANRFVVVPQVTRAAEDASELISALQARLKGLGLECRSAGGTPDVEELLAAYSRCRMLIGSRMHSCVFARAVGVPFVAISYDTGSKWGVLEGFWPPELIFEYTPDEPSLVRAARTVWTEGDQLIAASESAWKTCVTGVDENMSWLDEFA